MLVYCRPCKGGLKSTETLLGIETPSRGAFAARSVAFGLKSTETLLGIETALAVL